jgi:hypothetical protein
MRARFGRVEIEGAAQDFSALADKGKIGNVKVKRKL